MAKDAADAPSEVSDGNVSSAETDKTSADPDCPFLRVGGKIDWRSLERAEAEAQRRRRACAVARLGGGPRYAQQKSSTCTRRRNRRGHCDARMSPVRITGALMAKYGQSKEDAAALLASVKRRWWGGGETETESRPKRQKRDRTVARFPMPSSRCIVP